MTGEKHNSSLLWQLLKCRALGDESAADLKSSPIGMPHSWSIGVINSAR